MKTRHVGRVHVVRLAAAVAVAAAACTPSPDAAPAASPPPPTADAPAVDNTDTDLAAPAPDPAGAPPAPPPAVVPVTAPPAPPAPPPAVVPVTTTVACHPAYAGCLPLLTGDALDCADLAAEQRPVIVQDPSVDPYWLGDGVSRVACAPTAIGFELDPPPQDVAEPAVVAPPVDGPATPTSEPVYTPPTPAEPVAGATAPPIGDVGVPPPPPVEEPAPPPPPEPEPAEEPPPPPPPPPTTVAPDVPVAGVCVDVPADVSEVACYPEPVGDTIRLFGDFWAFGFGSNPGPEFDPGPDFTMYCFGGNVDAAAGRCLGSDARVARSRPLHLEAGTRISFFGIGGTVDNFWDATVVSISAEPIALNEFFEKAGEVVYGVTMIRDEWILFDTDNGKVPGFWGCSKAIYFAWLLPDGRWLLNPGAQVPVAGSC